MTGRIAECINILGEFCGKRDLPELSREALMRTYGLEPADVMVLFGGSVLCGGDVLAEAMRRKAAKRYGIVGGEGHTTADLRKKFRQEIPGLNTAGWPEAEIFDAYLKIRYRLSPDFLERCSTNCGNNITFLLELLRKEQIPFQSILLTQDATMQLRMEAGLRKYLPQEITIINYAAYSAKVAFQNSELAFEKPLRGMCGTWINISPFYLVKYQDYLTTPLATAQKEKIILPPSKSRRTYGKRSGSSSRYFRARSGRPIRLSPQRRSLQNETRNRHFHPSRGAALAVFLFRSDGFRNE